jgi:hypothetical protein
MRDILPVIRSKTMAEWKRWGHVPRLGPSGFMPCASRPSFSPPHALVVHNLV